MNDKKIKGDLGLVNVVLRLTELGFFVSLPISEHSKYDLIIEKENVCKTIQVRYTTMKNETISVKLRSTWADKNGSHARMRKKGDYDLLAVFEPKTKTTFFISDQQLNGLETQISFRMSAPMIKCKYRLITDYLFPLWDNK